MSDEFQLNGDVEESIPEETKPTTKKWPIVLGVVAGVFLGCVLTNVVSLAVTLLNKPAALSSSKRAMSTVNSVELGDDADLLKGDSSSKLELVTYLIKHYYYNDVDDETLIDGLYAGLVESLDDPYSTYYTAEEYENAMETYAGEYAGIGALLQKNMETGEVTITKVYENTPAEKAGLKEGDSIISANGTLAIDEDLEAFVQHIRGGKGTEVELVVNRDGEELAVTCKRDDVATPTVEHQMLNDSVGYIAISQFTEHTYKDFVKAYEDLEKQGMKSIVYDMRNNGGGLLNAVVDVLDYILPEGTVVYTMDKDGNKEDKVSKASSHKDIPIVVLVNGNTASAAEIFTGAIRDFKYGTIIGITTFGKGVVQSTIPLSDGSAIKLTTHQYYTPSGECIQGTGINPDIELDFEFLGKEDEKYSVDLDNQIQKAIEELAK
ncbi:MAG: S41 family peptidase [Pseudobutyrivibrio sp.]|nr:S41 family peptidase [Pseudobutyrivibrio sp.]